MALQSAKQASIQNIMMYLNGGLNYSQVPSSLADTELARIVNFIYDSDRETLMARAGTTCQTATALGASILQGFYYEKDSTTGYHVCVSGGKLYYLSGVGLDEWTEIGSLHDSTTVPFFMLFNSLLLIADGNSIHTWDGTTYAEIADSPKASILFTIRNRVVCNAVDEPDSVYLSGPEDATDWDTDAGAAIGLRAGFGDMMSINGFGAIGDDLIVSKKGNYNKRIYRVNVASSTPTEWYVSLLSENNSSQGAHTMISAWNNVFFIDSNGFKRLRGTADYGDLQIDYVGRRISPAFINGNTSNTIVYIPHYNAIWFNVVDRVFCYTERIDKTSGNIIPAFTEILFKWGNCTSIYYVGDDIYLTGSDGYLHKYDEDVSTDEVTPGVTKAYLCSLKTKTLTFSGGGILRKTQVSITPNMAGAGAIYASTNLERVKIADLVLTDVGTFVYDATGYLADATDTLYNLGDVQYIETTRDRVRGIELTFEVEISTGRCGIEWCRSEVALVNGG